MLEEPPPLPLAEEAHENDEPNKNEAAEVIPVPPVDESNY